MNLGGGVWRKNTIFSPFWLRQNEENLVNFLHFSTSSKNWLSQTGLTSPWNFISRFAWNKISRRSEASLTWPKSYTFWTSRQDSGNMVWKITDFSKVCQVLSNFLQLRLCFYTSGDVYVIGKTAVAFFLHAKRGEKTHRTRVGGLWKSFAFFALILEMRLIDGIFSFEKTKNRTRLSNTSLRFM